MRKTVLGIALGLTSAGAATGIGVAASLEGRPGPLALYMLAVVAAVVAGGVVPGLVTAAASFVLASWFVLAPVHAFAANAESGLAAGTLLVTAVAVWLALVRARRSAARLLSGLGEREARLHEASVEGKRLASIVATSVDGIVVVDERGIVEFFNPASERLFGYEADEVLGRSIGMLMPEPYATEHPHYFARYLETGEAKVIGKGREVLGLRKDGSTFPFDLSVSEADLDGRRIFTGVVHDLSARRWAEDELREREQQLRLVIQGAKAGTWRWDIGADTIEWSEGLGPLHGLPPGSSPATYEEYLERIHPGDREQLQAAVERAAVAGIDFALEFRTRWPDGTVRWLETRTHVLRDENGTPSALIGLSQDVTPRKQREQAQRLLAEASTLLASTLDYRETLQALGRVAVATVADWCTVNVLREDGTFDPVAVVHTDPERVRLARDLTERYPIDPDEPYGVAEVVRTGRPLLYSSIPDALLVEIARDAEHLEMIRSLGLRSAIVAPVALRGKVFGAITLASAESGRTYEDGDLAAVEELAHRAALAVDNALVHEEERRARTEAQLAAARALRLQSVVASLAEAATSEDIARVLVREGAAALEADAGVVYLLDDETGELELVAQDGYPDWFVSGYGRLPLNAPNAAAEAMRSAEPRWYSSAEEYHRAHPEYAESFDALGYRALAFLPLETQAGVLGVVGVSFSQPRRFAPEEREHLTALAGQCALAVERARLYEREHRVAVTLQQSLLPRRLPRAPGVALAVRYLPGSQGLQVGGDWFDAIPLPDGRLSISIGDVVGRGVRAAATMAQLRYALRAYALEGLSPAESLERLDAFTDQLGEREFATVLCLELDPASGAVRFANAGHLPPLLLDGRTPRYLEEGRSMPLGVEASLEREEDTFALEPGSTLVLYTDGLVEARSLPLGDGLTRLLDAAACAPREPDELLDAVLERLGAFDPVRQDDIAVLAVQLEPEPERRLDLEFDASPSALASIRSRLREWLAELDLDAHEEMEILVACGEACTNAIEHPRHPSDARLYVQARVAGDQLEIRVRDTGRWRVPQDHPTRGFGLPFMEELMHEVDVIPSDTGTEVRLRRRLGPSGSRRLPV